MSTVFDGIEHNVCAILAAGMNRFPDTGPVTFILIRKEASPQGVHTLFYIS
jgi:hypothetical protein